MEHKMNRKHFSCFLEKKANKKQYWNVEKKHREGVACVLFPGLLYVYVYRYIDFLSRPRAPLSLSLSIRFWQKLLHKIKPTLCFALGISCGRSGEPNDFYDRNETVDEVLSLIEPRVFSQGRRW